MSGSNSGENDRRGRMSKQAVRGWLKITNMINKLKSKIEKNVFSIKIMLTIRIATDEQNQLTGGETVHLYS